MKNELIYRKHIKEKKESKQKGNSEDMKRLNKTNYTKSMPEFYV